MAKKDNDRNFGLGIGVGVALGVAFGLLMDNLAIGIAIGISLGVAFDSGFAEKENDLPEKKEILEVDDEKVVSEEKEEEPRE